MPVSDFQVPARHYFLFGRPIDTSVVDERDREACQVVYDRARLSVEAGIDYLLKARQHDPYGDGAKRLLYETVMRTQASLPAKQLLLDTTNERNVSAIIYSKKDHSVFPSLFLSSIACRVLTSTESRTTQKDGTIFRNRVSQIKLMDEAHSKKFGPKMIQSKALATTPTPTAEVLFTINFSKYL